MTVHGAHTLRRENHDDMRCSFSVHLSLLWTRYIDNEIKLEISIITIVLCSEISADPSDTTVFAGWRAVFFCTTRDAAGHWKINETRNSDLSSTLRSDIHTELTQSAVFYFLVLNLLGRVEYNHTRVHCEIENEDGSLVQSEIAVLSVQGIVLCFLVQS